MQTKFFLGNNQKELLKIKVLWYNGKKLLGG